VNPRAAAVCLAMAACSRTPHATPGASGTTSDGAASAAAASLLGVYLPDVAGGFRATPVVVGEGWVRRNYMRGTARVDVTVARMETSYTRWVTSSTEYPQIDLGAAADRANGFYDCSDDSRTCDAHVHMRSGIHVELMGGRTTSRRALDELLAGLPLRELAMLDPEAPGK
jgi:hypothetical protein